MSVSSSSLQSAKSLADTSQVETSRARLHPMLGEYYRILQAAAAGIPGDQRGWDCMRIGVTSLRRSAGVSTLASNLALSMVKVGRQKVTLLEANRHRPSMKQNFKSIGSLGFTDVIASEREPSDARYEVEQRLSLVPIGRKLSSRRLAKIPSATLQSTLTELQRDSDWLLVDLPIASDRFMPSIGPRLQGVILLIQSSKATSAEVQRTKRRFDSLGIRILGTVFRPQPE